MKERLVRGDSDRFEEGASSRWLFIPALGLSSLEGGSAVVYANRAREREGAESRGTRRVVRAVYQSAIRVE